MKLPTRQPFWIAATLLSAVAIGFSPSVVAGPAEDEVRARRELASQQMRSAYHGVFYENDFGYLDAPFDDGPSFLGDSMKGMFGDRVDVGGEIRVRFHDERNHRGFGITGQDDSFWLTRYRMFLNYRISDHLRFFGEYIDADSRGWSSGGLSSVFSSFDGSISVSGGL